MSGIPKLIILVILLSFFFLCSLSITYWVMGNTNFLQTFFSCHYFFCQKFQFFVCVGHSHLKSHFSSNLSAANCTSTRVSRGVGRGSYLCKHDTLERPPLLRKYTYHIPYNRTTALHGLFFLFQLAHYFLQTKQTTLLLIRNNQPLHKSTLYSSYIHNIF